MTKQKLFEEIKSKQSFLCVGLDTDKEKIPTHLLSSKKPVLNFNKAIIDATKDLCVAYKLNMAFYEEMELLGQGVLKETIDYIPKDKLIIADAKRGDIGNTSAKYAEVFFEKLNVDAITLSPYMGKDTVIPFLKYANKWSIILALTSNKGAEDFQLITDKTETHLFEHILNTSKQWGTSDNIMFVVGATKGEYFTKIREIVPNHFLLVPGVGKQGGSLAEVCKGGLNSECGLLVNSSRGIIYASSGVDFAESARKQAESLQLEMSSILSKSAII